MEGHIHGFATEISLAAMPGPQFDATHSKFKIELLLLASWYISIDISNAEWWQVQGVDRIFYRITEWLFIYKIRARWGHLLLVKSTWITTNIHKWCIGLSVIVNKQSTHPSGLLEICYISFNLSLPNDFFVFVLCSVMFLTLFFH